MVLTGVDVLKGFTRTRVLGSGYETGGLDAFPIANGYNVSMGNGDPVTLVNGVLELAGNDDVVLGILEQVDYINDDGELKNSDEFVAGTVSKAGAQVAGEYRQPVGLVSTNPNQLYAVRTADNTTLAAAQIGETFAMTGFGPDATGRSQAIIDTDAVVSETNQMVTVVGLYVGRNSRFGETPVAVEVKLSNQGL